METPSQSNRTGAYRPALALFSAFSAFWVFILVSLGAFTTTINAGMAFPDWPLSNGSLNPPGWLTNLDMFAEHSHRLSATTMGLLTIVLAVWIWRVENRRWLRALAGWAVALVVLQGVVGGLRVLCDGVAVRGFDMTLGQMLRIPHGIIAQVYVCVLIAIAASCSRSWILRPVGLPLPLRRLGRICVGLAFIQLMIGAVMRHNNAGLAIPTFPWAGPDHRLLPAVWSFPVAIHFAHRAMAFVLMAAVVSFVLGIWRERQAPIGMRLGASFLVSLIALQILLGASIIWTQREAGITTLHVLVGAMTLATTFWLTWAAHRTAFDPAGPPSLPGSRPRAASLAQGRP